MINRYVHDPGTYPNRDISATKLGIQNHGGGDTIFYRRIQVNEHGPEPACENPGSEIVPDDQFSGSQLDGCRWNRTVRYDPPGLEVSGDHLNLESSYADIFGAENSPVTNMVLQDAPEGDWTAETKVTVPLVQCCQQAGLIAYLDDGNYVKWDVIADDGAGQARFELRSEIDDAVQDPQADVWVDYPADDTYWLRLTKSGATYSAAYSFDGESWTEFGTEVANPAIGDGAAIGLFTSGAFQDAPTWAGFDWFTLSNAGQVNTPPVVEEITGDSGEPELEVVGVPSVLKVKKGQTQATLRFRATNTGDAPSGPVELCVKAPRKKLKVKGAECVTREIPAGETAERKVNLKVEPKARGKTTKVELTARGPEVATQRATVRVRVGR
jgi:regulation of enolase protein 1 (concanavalin A-like superfamily)